MKHIILIIISLFPILTYCQDESGEKKYSSNRRKHSTKDNHSCVETKKNNVIQRGKIYPFNRSYKIEIVSFEDINNYNNYSVENADLEDSIKNKKPSNPIQTLNYSSKYRNIKTINRKDNFSLPPFKEVVMLSNLSKDSLSHILFNIKYLGSSKVVFENKCYQPRNAIIFYDREGNLLEYLEICFSCNGNRISWNDKNIDWCDSKYRYLIHFFRQSGVNFGTYILPPSPSGASVREP